MKKNRSDENTPDAKNQSEVFVVYCGGSDRLSFRSKQKMRWQKVRSNSRR